MVNKIPRFDAMECEKCSIARLNANLIRKHNADNYPLPLCTISSRLGSKAGDLGAVATMIKEPVKCSRLWGVEVETEISMDLAMKKKITRLDVARSILNTIGKNFIIIKEDGTLLMNGKYNDGDLGNKYAGFEIVSAPASIEYHRQYWPKLEESEHYPLLRAWDTNTCGFHVHVSRDSLNPLELGKLLVFLNHKNNRKFIWKVAGRSEMAFCHYEDRKISDANHPERVVNKEAEGARNVGRRTALNISNRATIEWRIFRGTVNPRHIIRNLEFCESLLAYCETCERSIQEMGEYKKYIGFVNQRRKNWPFLAEWFAYHDIINLKKILRPDIAKMDKLTIRIDRVTEPELVNV